MQLSLDAQAFDQVKEFRNVMGYSKFARDKATVDHWDARMEQWASYLGWWF